MKKIFYILTATAFIFSSCEKEPTIVSGDNQNKLVTKSFTVSAPDTKTSLNGINVIWSEGDQINVIEVNSEGSFVAERDFTLKSGAGEHSAVFVGEVASTDNTFYAIYPNIKLNTQLTKISEETVVDIKKPNSKQTAEAVENGFDPHLAIMTAVCNNNSFTFRHAVAFLKLTIKNDDIKSIKITSEGGARIFGRAGVVLSTGEPSAVNGTSSSTNYITLENSNGTFVKESFYLVPITIKPNNNLGRVTLTATNTNQVESSLSAAFNNLSPTAGTIYNIGSPVFNFDITPVLEIKKTAITDIPSDEASLTIYSAYSLKNCEDSDIVVNCDGTVINSASISTGNISYTITQNTGSEPRTGWIGLKLGDNPVQRITVTQAGHGAAVASSYYFYIKEDNKAFNTDNRFTHSDISPLAFSTTECGGPFNVESTDVIKGFKLNSGAFVQFKTSDSVTAKVTFYYTARKSGDIASSRIKITPTEPSGDAIVFKDFNQFGTPSFQTVSLNPNTTYKIERDNKELALILVKLVETPIE